MKPDDIQQWAWDEAGRVFCELLSIPSEVYQEESWSLDREHIARALLEAERRGMAAADQQMKPFRAAAEEAYWLMAYNWQSHLTGPGKPFDMSIFAPEARDMMTKAEQDLFDALSEIEP